MDKKEKLYTDFQKTMEKQYGKRLSLNEAKEALDSLAKFFELLWKFDQDDKRKAKQIENQNHATGKTK